MASSNQTTCPNIGPRELLLCNFTILDFLDKKSIAIEEDFVVVDPITQDIPSQRFESHNSCQREVGLVLVDDAMYNASTDSRVTQDSGVQNSNESTNGQRKKKKSQSIHNKPLPVNKKTYLCESCGKCSLKVLKDKANLYYLSFFSLSLIMNICVGRFFNLF